MSYRTLSFTVTAAALCLFAATASTFAQSMDSVDFAYRYEATSGLPNVEDSGAGKTNWAPFLFTGSVSVADGLLSYSTMPNAGGGSWFESSADAPGSAWLAQVSAATSYTIEFRAKVTESVGIVPGLHVFADNGVNVTWFNVDTTKVGMGAGHGETAVLVDGVDNSSDFHVYRIAYDAVDVDLQVWRDGVAIAADLAPAQSTVYKVIGFGDATSDGSSAGSIDYFRWDPTGAYAPVPEPGTLTLLGLGALSLLGLRKR